MISAGVAGMDAHDNVSAVYMYMYLATWHKRDGIVESVEFYPKSWRY